MSIKFDIFKKTNLLIVGLILLIIYLLSGQINSSNELHDFKEQILKFELSEQKYIERIDENGDKIIEQQQVILSQKDAVELGLLKIAELKKVNSQVVINTIIRIDSVFIPITDTVHTIVYDTSGVALLSLPASFGVKNEWYSLNTTIDFEGKLIDSLSLFNRQTITFGMKSNGLFKKPSPMLLLTNDNPYVRVNELNNIVIKNDLRFYDKNKFWFYAGLGVGIIAPIILIK